MNISDKIEIKKLDDLIPYINNPKEHPGEQVDKIASSIKNFGFSIPLIIDINNEIIAGHGRYQAAKKLQLDDVPCIIKDDLSEAQIKAFRIADNKVAESEWNFEALFAEMEQLEDMDFDLKSLGFDEDELEDFFRNDESEELTEEEIEEAKASLAERFIVPPFSVLDTKQGYWQDRKTAWLNIGIKGEESREEMEVSGSFAGSTPNYYNMKAKKEKELKRELSHNEFQEKYLKDMLPENSRLMQTKGGGMLSVFDPVLCELAYRWFCVDGGRILDPFAGGSTRGVVAGYLGYEYTGIELREEQVESNRKQGDIAKITPKWINGDSNNLDELVDGEFDFIFSCPPYYDLEIYSDNEGEMSALGTYEEFINNYRNIIRQAVNKLKDDRFACFVVGDIRDKKTGLYRNFVSDTISAFQDSGAMLYNEAILVTALGSLPIRTGRTFASSRKLGKTHQNVLVFFKGEPKKIKEIFGTEIEAGELEENEE